MQGQSECNDHVELRSTSQINGGKKTRVWAMSLYQECKNLNRVIAEE